MTLKRARPLVETLECRALFAADPVGLQGVYFDTSSFGGKSVSRVDPQVNFSWSGAPIGGIGSETFSVRWNGTVTPKVSENFTFYLKSNDGGRLWVNHKLLIDHWSSHSSGEDKGSIALKAGEAYDIQVEFWDNTGTATAQLKWSSASTPKGTIPSARLTPASQNLLSMLDHDLVFASSQLKRTMSELGNDTSKLPLRTGSNGKWETVSGKDWTSGFFGGSLFQMFQATGSSYWRDKAKLWTTPLANQTNHDGDLWFRVAINFMPLYEATGNPEYRQVLLNAAASKNKTWNETVGAFQSTWRDSSSGDPRANFGLLVDQTTDMQLMLWAADQSGNQTYRDRAIRHAVNVVNSLIHPDGSTSQWAYFDTGSGDLISLETYQGLSDTSTWSRGQGWAIYALADIAQRTAVPEILAGAQRTADYFIDHLPANGVPYWDFDDPKIPNTYRDSSAAAIAASGLLQLSTLMTDATLQAKYREAAEKILTTLSSRAYLAEGTTSRGLLLHAAQNVPKLSKGNDVSLIWGDYYFLEAINRYRAMT